MFSKRLTCAEVFRSVFVLFILVTGSSVNASSIEGEAERCATAKTVNLNSSLRGFAGAQGEPALIELTVPSAGILSVDVSVPGAAVVEPKIEFEGRGCGSGKADAEPVILDRSATHFMLLAEHAGSYFFGVGSQDRLRSLGDFKVRTGFVPRARTGPTFDKEGEDEEEIEVEIDPLIRPGGAVSRSLHTMLHRLCSSGEVDDHGDSFSCATFMSPGSGAVGEIRNGWGDDDDVFQLVLGGSHGADFWTVVLEAAGDIETFGILYDRSGQRLENSGSGNDEGFRMVRTLPSGVYYVRVRGRHGAEGSYRLNVDASRW